MTGRRRFVGQLGALAAAKYRVVFNASEVNDGEVRSYAASFFEDYRTVHGTTDQQTRPVIVFRRLGTPMALNDHLWERYAIGEDLKLKDPDTHAFATRNVFWKARKGAAGWEADMALVALQRRGLISLIPGAILVPSGIYGLIRAQNAGCAYMPGG